MKKIKLIIIAIITIFTLNINVSALSKNFSVSPSNVYVGDSFTVSVGLAGVAAWNVHTSVVSGPVSGCVINEADVTNNASNTSKMFTATCTATGVGNAVISLSGDVTSEDGQFAELSDSRTVTISERPAPPPSPPSTPTQPTNPHTSNNTTPNNNNNNNQPQPQDTRSSNANLKSISVEGYNLTKADNNTYKLTVPYDVVNINIKATPEDSKAKITGTGNHNLKIRENKIELIITSEAGTKNTITIIVYRNDCYSIDDLDRLLNKDLNDINIVITADTTITAKDLEKIKKSKKTVKFHRYELSDYVTYSWIIDGSKIKNTKDFVTTLKQDSDNKKDILRLSNYADGLFASINKKEQIPNGTKIKLFVGNKYNKSDLVNVYSYVENSEQLKLINKKLKVRNGYINFDTDNATDYFITMSNIPTGVNQTKSDNNIVLIIFGIVIGCTLVLIGLMFKKIIKKKKNEKVSIEPTTKPVIEPINEEVL